MADDKAERGPADASRINVNEAYEMRYWMRSLRVTEQKLRSAVAAAGVRATDVGRYLGVPEH